MKLVKPGNKSILLAVFLLTFLTLAQAQSSEITVDNGELWANQIDGYKELAIQTPCTEIESYNFDPGLESFDKNNGELSRSFSSEDVRAATGSYDVSVTCGDGKTSSADDIFSLNSFDVVRLEEVSGTANWRGEEIAVKVGSEVTGPQDEGIFTYDLTLINDGEERILVEDESAGSSATFNPVLPENVRPVDSPLILEAEYSPQSSDATVKNQRDIVLNIKSPWDIEVSNATLDENLIDYNDLGSFERDVEINYKNEAVNTLSNSDFFLTVEETGENSSVVSGLDEETGFVSSRLMSWKDGKYRVGFDSIPNLKVGKYNFKIGINHEDHGKKIVDSFQVDNYVQFSGIVIDSAGSAVNTNFQAVRDRTSPGISSSNGEYSASLLPGDYNMTVSFPETTIDFWNVAVNAETVDFRGDNQPIRYNDLTADQLKGTVQGATVLNAVAVDFAIPFEEADAVMDYDSSQAAFDEVEVMQCSQWVGGSCSSDWEPTDSNRTQVDLGQVTFPVHTSDANGKNILRNAFMVIKNTDLVPKDLTLGDDRIPRGETLPFSGKVESAEGNAVPDANVNITLRQGSDHVKSQVIQSSSNGQFQASMEVPEESGTYSIDISGEKQPFNSFSSEDVASFDTYVPRELSIETPDSAEFYIGETAELSFDVLNTGSAEAEDVKLRVSGLKNTWYEFQQQEWNSLQPGDRREALMRVDLPDGYCESECKEYPKFEVEVVGKSGGQSLRTVQSVQAVVTKNNESEVSGNQSSSGGMSLESPEVVTATGDFLASQSSLNLVLSLVMVFMLVLAGAVKHKKSSDRNGSRGGRSIGGGRGSNRGGGRPNVQRPDVSSSAGKSEESGSNESSEEQSSESSEESVEEEDVLKCSKCGEKFDTESALKIHKQAIH